MPANLPRETTPITCFEDVLSRAGVRDRASMEKHLALVDAESDPGHGRLWRRLIAKLAELAGMPVQMAGSHAAMFFIADGKFRMQVFSLEDRRDGQLLLFLPDIMDRAIRSKLVVKSGGEYVVAGSAKRKIPVQAMDASNTADPPPHVKHMIGWNRKAVMLTLESNRDEDPQVAAAESLCALAAQQWSAR